VDILTSAETRLESRLQSLPTYDWLADAGITPDPDRTHTLEDLTSALQQSAGVR